MAFVQRAIDVTVTLGEGSFGEAGPGNTVTLSGYRVSARIEKNSTPSMNTAQIRIYGMDLSLINRLSQIGYIPQGTRRNIVSVAAGDAESGMSTCFAGIVTAAWPDFQAAPEVAFNLTAATGMLDAVKPAQPSSYHGPTDVAIIMASLAKQMGYTFENNGVSVILSSPYFWGTARQQALSAARAANIFVVFDDENGVMAIIPMDGARGTLVPVISPETGMVGYPEYTGPGKILVRTLYNPAVQFLGRIDVQSSFEPASGRWRVIRLAHSLESQNIDGGDWFTEIVGNRLLASAPV